MPRSPMACSRSRGRRVPGEEMTARGKMKAARDLLEVIDRHGNPFPYVDIVVLRDGLDPTQPTRHGRSDDEFAILQSHHVATVVALDEHSTLDAASSGRDINQLIWHAFEERAQAGVALRPKGPPRRART